MLHRDDYQILIVFFCNVHRIIETKVMTSITIMFKTNKTYYSRISQLCTHRRRKVGAQGAPAPPTLTGRGQSPPTFGQCIVQLAIVCLCIFFYYMHLIISSVHDQFHF